MKKVILTVLAAYIGLCSIGQTSKRLRQQLPAVKKVHPFTVIEQENKSASGKPVSFVPAAAKINPVAPAPLVNVVNLGKEGNAFGTCCGAKQQLWADPNLNEIVMTHRADPAVTGDGSSGWLRYDVSKNGGTTWLVNQGAIYQSNNSNAPPFANARYPQGMIYNPTGNTIADSAFVTYYAPSLPGTNDSWGGHVWGSSVIGIPSVTTRTELLNSRNLIPGSATMTKTGNVFVVDGEQTANPFQYKDSILVRKGTWNAATRDMNYTTVRFAAPMAQNAGDPIFAGATVAFEDNGTTGYIAALGHRSFAFDPDTTFYPSVYKTIDGGATWNWISDIKVNSKMIDTLFFNDTSQFTCAFDIDMICDINGNPHIIVGVSFYVGPLTVVGAPQGLFLAYVDLSSPDKGNTWRACLIGKPSTFRGSYGDGSLANPTLAEDNRPQVSRTWSGDKLFFTYFDTDTNNFPGQGNLFPDMITKGYNVTSGQWTNLKNITLSDGINTGTINQGIVSDYVLGSTGTYTIPCSYTQFAANDPIQTGSPAQLRYITDATFTDAEFNTSTLCSNMPVGIPKLSENNLFSVTSSYPNPFSGSTSFDINLVTPTSVSVEVVNVLGETVIPASTKQYSAGNHTLTINASRLSSGVYFYTVKTEKFSVTKKMMVK